MKTTFSSLPPELVKEVTRYLPLSSRGNLRLQSRRTSFSDYDFLRYKSEIDSAPHPFASGLAESNRQKAIDYFERGVRKYKSAGQTVDDFIATKVVPDVLAAAKPPKTYVDRLVKVVKTLPENDKAILSVPLDKSYIGVNVIREIFGLPALQIILTGRDAMNTGSIDEDKHWAMDYLGLSDAEAHAFVFNSLVQDMLVRQTYDIRNGDLLLKVLEQHFGSVPDIRRVAQIWKNIPLDLMKPMVESFVKEISLASQSGGMWGRRWE